MGEGYEWGVGNGEWGINGGSAVRHGYPPISSCVEYHKSQILPKGVAAIHS